MTIRTTIIIQARTSSSRLPGKVLMEEELPTEGVAFAYLMRGVHW